jgi:transcriptional regulator with XRE-family HTH domain
LGQLSDRQSYQNHHRSRPAKPGKNLKQLWIGLGLTQAEMAEKVKGKGEAIYAASISQYERGLREPSLLVLLRYARLGGVTMEMLIDDKINLF